MRGQTELLALGMAIFLLTGTVVAGVVLANSSLTAAEQETLERQTATTLSDRLVSAEAPHTVRENVIVHGELATLTETQLEELYNIPAEATVALTLDGREVLRTGPTAGGSTVERIVLVERRAIEHLHP